MPQLSVVVEPSAGELSIYATASLSGMTQKSSRQNSMPACIGGCPLLKSLMVWVRPFECQILMCLSIVRDASGSGFGGYLPHSGDYFGVGGGEFGPLRACLHHVI